MTFKKAVLAMMEGKKVQRKTWLKDDYIYINTDSVIYCDGEYAYIKYLRQVDFTAKDWRVIT